MTILIGPCMLLAPLVAVLAVLALPLWPVAIVIVATTWLLVWPIERVTALCGLRFMQGWSVALGHTLYYVVKPWAYLDKRYPMAARSGSR